MRSALYQLVKDATVIKEKAGKNTGRSHVHDKL